MIEQIEVKNYVESQPQIKIRAADLILISLRLGAKTL